MQFCEAGILNYVHRRIKKCRKRGLQPLTTNYYYFSFITILSRMEALVETLKLAENIIGGGG